MVSEASKRRLEAFSFVDQAVVSESSRKSPRNSQSNSIYSNHPIDSNKENVLIAESWLTGAEVKCKAAVEHESIPVPNASQSSSREPVPCTPVNPGRLPLKHLLGSVSEKVIAPIHPHQLEDLSWKQPTPPQKTWSQTPRRTEKQVCGSSPIAGSAERFITPKQDPAAEVWSRFRGDARLHDPNRPEIDGMDSLLVESSPHSPATAGSVSGLRRYSSCGHQWPAMRKRRREGQAGHSVAHIDYGSLVRSPPPAFKKSKITQILIEAERLKAQNKIVAKTNWSNTPPRPTKSIDNDAMAPNTQAYLDTASVAETPCVPQIPSRAANTFGTRSLPQTSTQAAAITQVPSRSTIVYDPVIGLHETQPPTQANRLEMHPHDFDDFDDFGDLDDDDLDSILAPATEQHTLLLDVVSGPATCKNALVTTCPDDATNLRVSSSTKSHDIAIVLDNNSAVQRIAGQDSDHSKILVPEISVCCLDSADMQQLRSDDFGDDDLTWDDFAAAEAAATQQPQTHDHAANLPDSSEGKKTTIQRYIVKTVQERRYIDQNGRDQPEQMVVVEEEKTCQLKTIVLRQSWYNTQCTKNSFVHVLGKFDCANRCVVDDLNNILILHPDHLVSATVVADSFGCLRRAVLQDRVKATGSSSEAMLCGNILHELFQEAMSKNIWAIDTLQSTLDRILPKHLETLAQLNVDFDHVRSQLNSRLYHMSAWASKFVRERPASDALVQSRNGVKSLMNINKLLDVEEHVWSPNYGLKGNIDATVQVVFTDEGQQSTLTVPLELKTGKTNSEAHQAQTALYTLLISDRYDITTTDGILYYVESSNTFRIKSIRRELVQMIMKRNELACYIRERRQLPPILTPSRQRLCNGCYAQTSCFLYHKLSENGNSSTMEKKQPFEQLVQNLKPIHARFFQQWERLITKEESEMVKFRRELWTMLSYEREKLNRCFANVIIDSSPDAGESMSTSKINKYQYTFRKRDDSLNFSFTDSQITTGEPIVISDEKGHFALANGYVESVHAHRITVAVDRRLHNARIRQPGFSSKNHQVFSGIMELSPSTRPNTSSSMNIDTHPILYRIDKDEFSNGMAIVRHNLLQIMDDSVSEAGRLRALIIEGREPVYKPCASGWQISTQWGAQMNSDQEAAIEKVMSAKDYALVLGMPGTGKTTTISQIIQSLVAKNKTVLLTSYTHTAVDNILLKLRHSNIDILRLGVLAKIHPQVKSFAHLASEPKQTIEEVYYSWHQPKVVATTCLGTNHPIFARRVFDYCIVDEASQITLPVCLGPIRMAKAFILVGDHYQLPPLVQNNEALEGGLDISLFRLLSERHETSVVSLEHQYRMCENIMMIANRLIYNGRLKCGSPEVAHRVLDLPNTKEALEICHSSLDNVPPCHATSLIDGYICPLTSSSSCWLNPLLQASNQVLLLNTDALGFCEIKNGNRITNPIEAKLISQIISLFLDAGMSENDLGVVTFYRSQLALLRASTKPHSALELHTADKFQGRDKEAIIVSFVRSNSEGNVGDLLQDWRRINVAITRARSKLILICSVKTLSNGPEVLRGLVALGQECDWIVNLPQRAVDMHHFPDPTCAENPSPLESTIPMEANNEAVPKPEPIAGRQDTNLITSSSSSLQDTLRSAQHLVRDRPAGSMLTSSSRQPSSQQTSGARLPDKVARAGQRLLSSRPMIKDILNDLLLNGLVGSAVTTPRGRGGIKKENEAEI